MYRFWPIPVLLLLTGGCVTTTERDCGMYDFDCQDAPRDEALIQPDRDEVATAASPTATPAATVRPTAADLESRVRRLEAEVDRLRRRLEALE